MSSRPQLGLFPQYPGVYVVKETDIGVSFGVHFGMSHVWCGLNCCVVTLMSICVRQ